MLLEFTPDPKQARTGSLMQWSYDEMGIITFSTELWNPELAAGIEGWRRGAEKYFAVCFFLEPAAKII